MAQGFPTVDFGPIEQRTPFLTAKAQGVQSAPNVLADETFENGPEGWVQLYTQNLTAQCPMAWIKDRHAPRLEVRTPDIINLSGMGIRRYSTTLGDGFYMIQWLASIHDWDSSNPRPTKGPKWFEWALDTARDDGTRNYFQVTYMRNAVGTNVAGVTTDVTDKIMLRTYSAGVLTYHDMGSFTWPVNESKCLPIPITLLVNTTTGKYHGLSVGRWIKKGFFANPGNADLTSLPAASGPPLPRFSSGFNSLFAVLNLPSDSFTEGVSELLRHRITYLGSAL